ncbi:DNA damage-repair/toleration protein DRT102 [Nymphaea colorata]|uniref:Cupin type-2 domain-containing protein n=1 Tax=Nymphaea colorata TaxID=210225 RepID=A0A5K0VH21_9MAGN|nr:DNA damage-repair/toleration protein DRT102 [Nymphaea colorata]
MASEKKAMKIITGADDFGCKLKDAVVAHLRSKGIDVEDLGTGKYYSVGEEIGRRVSLAHSSGNDGTETRGILACGTGVGVSIFANKFPGVYAATCGTIDEAVNCRSINDSNVLSLSGMFTPPELAQGIVDAWLDTPFKSPCRASGGVAWPGEIDTFLSNSLSEMSKIPGASSAGGPGGSCAICSLREGREFEPVAIMPGGSMKIVRQSPTAAIVRFAAGSLEPAHHHTFGHDLVVLSGRKKVWNLSKKESYELGPGDYLYTPAPDVHRVQYFTDTEFFIRWDGDWDIFIDEDLAAAAAATKGSSDP